MTLDEQIEAVNAAGWRIHNLYQGERQWEARIKYAGSGTVYGNGEGATPSEALQAAFEAGCIRREWKPSVVSKNSTGANTSTRKHTSTTDDLLDGFDL